MTSRKKGAGGLRDFVTLCIKVESLFLGFLKEDLFYFLLIIFSKIFIFSYFIILSCYS